MIESIQYRVIPGANNYCVPAALSAILNLSVDECVNRMRVYLGDQPITGTYFPVAIRILRESNYACYQEHVEGCNITVNQFAKAKRPINSIYLLSTQNHALVLVGSRIIDNQFLNGVAYHSYPMKGKRLIQAWWIIPPPRAEVNHAS